MSSLPAGVEPSAARLVSAASAAFFFASGENRLFGTWRAPAGETPPGDAQPKRVWVFCPPFAEEEKSARRTLAELGAALCLRGDASLLFSYSGTGDSEGEFAASSLNLWRADIRAACAEARRRAPDAELALVGLRLGAALALQVAAEAGVRRLVLLEPVLQGRALLSALNQKKRLRAMMTKSEGELVSVNTANESLSIVDAEDDFDGWRVTRDMRTDLERLDVSARPTFAGPILVLQIGPRATLLPAIEQLAARLGATARALKMQPFWNLVDYARAEALFATLGEW